jgi:hypothetical protein
MRIVGRIANARLFVLLLALSACLRASTESADVGLRVTNESNDTTVAIPILKSMNETGFFAIIGLPPAGLDTAFGARVLGPKETRLIPFDSLRFYTQGEPLAVLTTRLTKGVTAGLRVTNFTSETLEKSGYSVSVSPP